MKILAEIPDRHHDIAFATRYRIDFMVRRNMHGGRRIESQPPDSLATAV
jgi:hypothetical protein